MVNRDVVVTILLWCECVHLSVRICPGHNSYIYEFILKLFDTVVVLEEEKCRLKFF